MATGSGTGTAVATSDAVAAIYNEYTTVADIKTDKGITDTDDDTVILDKIRDAAGMIDQIANRFFYPLKETRLFDVPEDHQDNNLWLDRDLLEVLTLLNGEGTTLTTAHYRLYPNNLYPKNRVGLKATSEYQWLTDANGEFEQVIPLTGIWGYHKNYTRAWASLTTLNGAITASITNLTLAAAGAKAGQLWKADSEFIYAGVVSGTAASTIVRGVNGSTAALHANGAQIYVWQPERPIAELNREAALALYLMKAHPGVDTIVIEGETFTTPRDVEKFIEKRLRSLGWIRK